MDSTKRKRAPGGGRKEIPVIIPAGTDMVLRPAVVAAMVGRSISSIYRDEKLGNFPKRRKLSPGGQAVGFLKSEVEAHIANLQAA